MLSRNEIRDWVNERFEVSWSRLQERWFENFGEYCQLIHEPSLPEGGAEKSGALGYGKPGDRPWGAEEFFKLGARKTKLKRQAEAKERAEEGLADKRESIRLRKLADDAEDEDETSTLDFREVSVAFDTYESLDGRGWTLKCARKNPEGVVEEYARGRDDRRGKWQEIEDLD